MRTSDTIVRVVAIGLALGFAPVRALDGTPSDGPPGSVDRMTAPTAPGVSIERLPSAVAPPGRSVPVVAAPSRLDMPRPPASVPSVTPGRAALPTPVEAFRSGAQRLRAGAESFDRCR